MVLVKNKWTPSFGCSWGLIGKKGNFLLGFQFWGSLVEMPQPHAPQNCPSQRGFLETISSTALAKEIGAHDSLRNRNWALEPMFVTLAVTCAPWRSNSPNFVPSESQYWRSYVTCSEKLAIDSCLKLFEFYLETLTETFPKDPVTSQWWFCHYPLCPSLLFINIRGHPLALGISVLQQFQESDLRPICRAKA